jgi:hypothetical protein
VPKAEVAALVTFAKAFTPATPELRFVDDAVFLGPLKVAQTF